MKEKLKLKKLVGIATGIVGILLTYVGVKIAYDADKCLKAIEQLEAVGKYEIGVKIEGCE